MGNFAFLKRHHKRRRYAYTKLKQTKSCGALWIGPYSNTLTTVRNPPPISPLKLKKTNVELKHVQLKKIVNEHQFIVEAMFALIP